MNKETQSNEDKESSETKFLKLLVEKKNLKFHKQIINYKIKEAKRELHRDFVKDNKMFLRICDICFVICILFNFVALALTNVMVTQERYGSAYETANEMITNGSSNKTASEIVNTELVVFKEMNPAMAKAHNLETIEENKAIMFMAAFFKQCLLWACLGFVYVWQRMHIRLYVEKYTMAFVILFYIIALGSDAFWDLGLWIGKSFFGLG